MDMDLVCIFFNLRGGICSLLAFIYEITKNSQAVGYALPLAFGLKM
jgi:hypothetical protein